MGLLDEAIREHLELKRRSGADPSTVEREEQEALAPMAEHEEVSGPIEQDDPGAWAHDSHVETGAADGDAHDDDQPAHASPAELSGGSQDTAELDMRAVLEEHPDMRDWELAGERDPERTNPADVPGQERLSFE